METENDIFNSKPNDEGTEFNVDNINVETLVGEGRKYGTPDELAKGYAHADAHIAKLKAELAEIKMREKILQDLEEAKNKNKQEDLGNTQERQEHQPAPEERKDKFSEVDIGELVRKELEDRDKKTSYSDNVNSSASKLAEKLGSVSEAQRFVETKAKELKVDVKWLMDVAGRSPDAFFRTVGINDISVNSPNANQQSDLNSLALTNQRNRRNFKYYEEIRKTDPKAYYSTELRKQLFEDARAQGSAFYT